MREADRALFNTDDVLEIDSTLVESLKSRAWSSQRGCFRLCLHHSPRDEVQEMGISSTPDH